MSEMNDKSSMKLITPAGTAKFCVQVLFSLNIVPVLHMPYLTHDRIHKVIKNWNLFFNSTLVYP